MPRRRVLRRLVMALGLVVVLASCGSNELEPGRAIDSGSDATSSTPPSTTPNELEGLLADRVPDGFSREADDVGDTGPSDLDKAVRDDPTEGARQALVEEGFVQGYQRLWTNAAGDELILFLYEFGSPEGAAADQARMRAAQEADSVEGLAAFVPPGLDPATTHAVAGTNGGRAAAIIDVATGTFHVQVVASGDGTDGEVMKTRATDLFMEQLGRL